MIQKIRCFLNILIHWILNIFGRLKKPPDPLIHLHDPTNPLDLISFAPKLESS